MINSPKHDDLVNEIHVKQREFNYLLQKAAEANLRVTVNVVTHQTMGCSDVRAVIECEVLQVLQPVEISPAPITCGHPNRGLEQCKVREARVTGYDAKSVWLCSLPGCTRMPRAL